MATNTYQPDGTAGKDTYLQSSTPTTNYGTNATLIFGNLFGTVYRTLIEFDISDIAAGSTISAAKITFTINTGVNTVAGHVYRLLRSDWVEAEATWNIYKSGNNWTTAGAGSTVSDHTTTDGVAFSNGANSGTFDITGLATLAQDALDNRSGKLILLIKDDVENDTTYKEVRSSDFGTASARPLLTVDYTAPSTNIKTINGLAKASVKTVNGLAIASVKTRNGLA